MLVLGWAVFFRWLNWGNRRCWWPKRAAKAVGVVQPLAAAKAAATQNNATFGQVFNSAFDATPEPAIEPTADQEEEAGLTLRAMFQDTKSDENLDDAEREKLIGQLGDDIASPEAALVQAEMKAPVDVDGLAGQVPRGMEPQIYAMSVIAINLDSHAEAKYLHQLAHGLDLSVEALNDVHAQLGVPSFYA